jgi:hypothetical protein
VQEAETGDDEQDPPPIASFREEPSRGKYGFINRLGTVVLKPQYDFAADFVDGLARVWSDGTWGVIDVTGKRRCTLPPETERVKDAWERMIWFLSSKEKKWGLADDQGRVILSPTYDDVERFSEGLAAVNLGAQWQRPGIQMGGKWGYVNKEGELVVPLKYEYVHPFSDGLANVSVASGAGERFIDRSGKPVMALLAQDITTHFGEGLAPIHTNLGLTCFVDQQGNTQLSVTGFAEEFHEGMAVFRPASIEDLYGYVDRHGKVIIRPGFGEVQPFSEGLAAVSTAKPAVDRRDSTWGYIDKTGEYRIAPVFNEARPFRGGVARVHMGGTFNPPFFHRRAFWEGGDWWWINSAGRKLKRAWGD